MDRLAGELFQEQRRILVRVDGHTRDGFRGLVQPRSRRRADINPGADRPREIAHGDGRVLRVGHAPRELDAFRVFEQVRQHARDEIVLGLRGVTRDAQRQRFVNAAIGVGELDVEVVDRCSERHVRATRPRVLDEAAATPEPTQARREFRTHPETRRPALSSRRYGSSTRTSVMRSTGSPLRCAARRIASGTRAVIDAERRLPVGRHVGMQPGDALVAVVLADCPARGRPAALTGSPVRPETCARPGNAPSRPFDRADGRGLTVSESQ